MNSSFLYSPAFIVVVEHGIASALYQLLTEAIAEEIIVGCFVFSVF
jgi:hypothetical protein